MQRRAGVRTALLLPLVLLLQSPPSHTVSPTLGAAFDGDPVSLSTGLYTRSDDDLRVAGTPLLLTRTYRTRDDGKRPFGIGTSHSYHLYLVGDGKTFQWADLILEDGGRIHFRRLTPGQGHDDAVFEHTESPTEFYGSQLQWNGEGWNIDLRDGSRYTFAGCNPRSADLCHLLRRRDADGTDLQFDYDAAGNLARIRDGGAWIALTYDASQRIIQGTASSGAAVKYEYDRDGHLIRVRTSRGRLQEYTYGAHHEVLTIREPDRLIENTYDSSVRCIRQVITYGRRDEPPRPNPDVFTFAYRVGAAGKIVETRTTKPDGTLRVSTFNVNGYLVTDTMDPGGKGFTEVIYARDDRTNLAPRVTVRCAVGGAIVETTASVGADEHPDDVREALIGRTCRQ